MQVIVEIDEAYYKFIKQEVKLLNSNSKAHNILANGIPLPKGHGRLIDADALKKDDEVTEWLSLDAVRTGKMLKRFSELFIKKIDATPTIIEADKEDSENDRL